MLNKILLMLLFSSFSLSAIASDGSPKCNPEGTQMEMNVCAADDYAAADKKLNKTWKALITKQKDNKVYIKSLRMAQKAWIKFRDLEIEAMFACDSDKVRTCWGSMYSLLRYTELAEITEARTKRLQKFIDQGQNMSIVE